MKSFPHYQQHDQMDCGPTCLRMIAAFYGKAEGKVIHYPSGSIHAGYQ